ncbi:endonuclease domain-containing protein [Massilia antarctica]|uniref:endonuclease domain-containing protein n=1 Tax=Massilia antarctica TaxID=2765360 RepID=UPI0035A6E9D6
MLANNPVHLQQTRDGTAITTQARQLADAPKGEDELAAILTASGIDFVRQYIFGPYVCDFAFPADKVVIELDGKGHYGRRDSDARKDLSLTEAGWIVIRRPYDNLKRTDWHRFCRVLEKLIAAPNSIRTDPPSPRSQYRMFIRDPQNPAGAHVYDADSATVARLVHGRSDRIQSPPVGDN